MGTLIGGPTHGSSDGAMKIAVCLWLSPAGIATRCRLLEFDHVAADLVDMSRFSSGRAKPCGCEGGTSITRIDDGYDVARSLKPTDKARRTPRQR